MLYSQPSLILLIATEGFTFLPNKVNDCELAVVIRETDEIFLVINGFHRCRSPYIQMDFLLYSLHLTTHSELRNWLPMTLSPFAR